MKGLPILALFSLSPYLFLCQKVDEEELATIIEFDEFELEDQCIAKNNALVKFYNGTSSNLTEYLEAEIKTGSTLFNLSTANSVHKTSQLTSPDLIRKLQALYSPGAALLGENFSEYVKYAVGGIEALSRPVAIEGKLSSPKIVDEFFRTETNVSKLGHVWSQWVINLEKRSGNFKEQLEKLPIEAQKNGFESVAKYWLHQSEITVVDYEAVTNLWLHIAPLYQKLRLFIAPAVAEKFGRAVFISPKLIPSHVLGSLDSKDWVTAVERLGALKHSTSFSSVQSKLRERNSDDLYKAADETTAELRLGYLPDIFFKTSQFHVNSSSCAHHVDSVCKTERGYSPRVLACKDEPTTLSAYLSAHEEVARIKHLNLTSNSDKEGMEKGYLFREGLSDSVLYEAIASAASLLALSPESLHRRGLLPSKVEDADMTFLLLSALHLIPALPYHLAADTWRGALLNPPEKVTTTTPSVTTTTDEAGSAELIKNNTIPSEESEESTDAEGINNGDNEEVKVKGMVVTENRTENSPAKEVVNITEEWWSNREKLQGIGSFDGKPYADYLSDRYILWNKPQVSKFLGPILLFQILEHFKGGNTTENINLLQKILRQGKSQPWEKLVSDLFNITKISAEPLLAYFKPLEAFLDGNAKFHSNSGSKTQFAGNDFRKLLLGTASTNAASPKKGTEVKSASEDSQALLVALAALGVIGAVAIVITVAKKRIQKKKRAKRRRRLDLMSSS